jgi:hypothetical protein
VTEADQVSPWSFTSLVCDSTPITGQTATIELAAGETVKCTFTNEKASGQPLIVTAVSPSTITLGESSSDTATLSGGFNPKGTITFNVYGPSDTAVCTVGSEVFTSTVDVNGIGQYTSGPFTPLAAGRYWWVASYSGDGNNDPAFDICGASQYETLVVEPRSEQAVMMVDSGYMPARGGHDPRIPLLPVWVDGVRDTCPTPLPCTLTLQDPYAPGSMHTFTAPKTFKFGGVTFRFHHWQDENGARLSSKNSFKYPLQPDKTLTAIYTVTTITLTVYAYDAVTHKPIKGASVYDDDGTLLGVTNSRGRLVIRILPDPFRTHVLKITSTGHGDYYTLPIYLTKSRTVRAYIT